MQGLRYIIHREVGYIEKSGKCEYRKLEFTCHWQNLNVWGYIIFTCIWMTKLIVTEI